MPSEDFSRPGRTWYPTQGRTRFPLWGEVSTCYHEAVPGHHLQLGQVRMRGSALSRYQRTLAWVAGHGEGWALYAERLMGELGFLEEPDYELGMLRAQALRAAREREATASAAQGAMATMLVNTETASATKLTAAAPSYRPSPSKSASFHVHTDPHCFSGVRRRV